MGALSSAQQSEVKAWEEEILACEHTLTLIQEPVIVPGQGEPFLSFCFPTASVEVANLPKSLHSVPPAISPPIYGYVSRAALQIAVDSSTAE